MKNFKSAILGLAIASVSGSYAASDKYFVIDQELGYKDAVAQCANHGAVLANRSELEAIYASSMDSDGNSSLRGKDDMVNIWTSEKLKLSVDAVVILPALFAIPYLDHVPTAMTIYRFPSMKKEVMYVGTRRHIDGRTALSVCIEK